MDVDFYEKSDGFCIFLLTSSIDFPIHNSMKGATMLMTLYNLGVIPSYARPRVSNDNPFIESLFKTLKYTAGYPGQFKDMDHARTWMANFVNWYNTEHRHSAIRYVTPQQRRSGVYTEIFEKRNKILADAKKRTRNDGVKSREYGDVMKKFISTRVKKQKKG